MRWKTRTISELVFSKEAEIKTGPFGTQLKAAEYVEHGTPVINVRNIGFGSIRDADLEFIDPATTIRLSSHLLQADDIVFGRKGAVERHAYIKKSQSGWLQGSDCIRLRIISGDLLPRFLSYALLTREHQEWMQSQCSHGATMASLNQDIVGRIRVKAPDISQQVRIASILSAYDDLIENNTRRIAVLEEMARRIFEEWFVHFRAPGCETLPRIGTPLGPVPEGWEAVRLDTVIEFDPSTKVGRDGLKPFVPMTSLQNNSMLVLDIEGRAGNSGSKFRNGDSLLARITPCLENGKTGYVDFLSSDVETGFGSTEFIVMRGIRMPATAVQMFARSDWFRDQAIASMSGATGRQRVRRERLESLEIALPPKPLLDCFDELAKPMFKMARVLTNQSRNLRTQRDLLLPRLISGEIDVSAAPALLEAAE